MKKIMHIVFFFSLFVSIFGSSHVFAAAPAPTVMMEAKDSTSSDSAKDAGVSAEQKSEYALPYPGILSDHPLYFLKQIRDSIMERLIADPVRKIEFYVLQSDKDVNASIFLSSQQKHVLALQMIERSLTYRQQAINIAKKFKQDGKEVPTYIAERLQQSLQKQYEVFVELGSKSAKSEKAGVVKAVETVKQLVAETDSLK